MLIRIQLNQWFLSNEKYLITGGDDKEIRIIDLNSKQIVKKLEKKHMRKLKIVIQIL